jgi:hypothetical protein
MSEALTTIGALEALGHKLVPHPAIAAVGLAWCARCGRIWRARKCRSLFESLQSAWLRLVAPTGWTLTPDKGEFHVRVDRVEHLSALHQLLWNTEPCPGPPLADSCEDEGNARYRLMAMTLIDQDGLLRTDPKSLRDISAWCETPWAVRIAVASVSLDR